MGNGLVINFNIPLDQLVKCCWRRACSTRQSYRSLQRDWERLKNAKNDVEAKIELEEREHKRRLHSVVDWIQQVEAIKVEFDKLKTIHSQQSANKCFSGCSPRNMQTSFTFGNDVENLTKDVISTLERKPEEVTQNSLFAQPKKRPVGSTVGLESMLDKVWRSFEELPHGTIALYGMGGVGKTTLLKEVNNKLCHSNQKVDVVLWIVVSQNPTLSTIQNNIGEKVGFHNNEWKAKHEDEKAEEIYNVLIGKTYVLFLDDVWDEFDILKLGVPLPDETNKSKVVLSTRSYDVCGIMNADIKTQMSCLGEEQAWDLFSKKVGVNLQNAPPRIHGIAELIAKECDGLPLALIVIGKTVSKNTTLQAWKTSLTQLTKYTSEFKGMGDEILPLLKFSYDSIPNPVFQSCFLYCCLYPEDYLIRKKDLVDKWICEGFLDRFVDLKEAVSEANACIETLVNASLLEESSTKTIKLHDIIREMALWICRGCGEGKSTFFVGVGLTETPNLTEFEGSERMSLMGNPITKLNGKPNSPNLLTLFLNEAKLYDIDNEFFQSMTKLRVLDLSNNEDLTEIPEEVCNLVNLHYLNLEDTGISKLPINLSNLINLKWLSIRANKNLIQLPEGLLSNFKKLQVLYLYKRIGLPKTFLAETGSLEHLKDLRFKTSP